MVKLSIIHQNPKNPRFIKDDRFNKLIKSIKEFPQMMELRPIIINDNNIIQGGNMRYRALKELGYKEIPDSWVKQGKELTPEQWREFVIKDNLAFGEWDMDMLDADYNIEELMDWGFEMPEFFYGNNNNEWKLKTDEVDENGDGIIELLGYNNSSMWYEMPRIIDGITEKLIKLPLIKKNTTRGSIVKDGGKYSRTIPEEIRRIIVTYMRKGDYFLENCCGWATFSAIAKLYGYSGIGVDIWDVALKYSNEQIKKINNGIDVKIIKSDGMRLPFNDKTFSFIYCNPPFMDAEMYSGEENDIATKDRKKFESNISMLIKENYRVLKNNCLMVMTIGDQRKNGILISNQALLIQIGISIGFILHDFVISENIGIANIMRKKSYEQKRTAKNHEFIIVFKKN